ncbi:hypothetical protein [Massilia sp. erpn]|uniref:hypothetical protein n=1 Tax=Massilia sp. erpn TaxID=2738142 RepID=UPI0021022C2D|nr:hypothetical protein [Massilia sp. erpn]UTY56157.1 hypothetical protein HPQ68_02490 [Massilia sp. erpn]
MEYSVAEREAMGLCICLEALNGLMNHQIISINPTKSAENESTAMFDTSIHRDLFLIRLLDFAKESGDKQLTGVQGSCLTVLSEACKSASFEVSGSARSLRSAVKEIDDWLNHEREMKLWLPTLGVDAKITVSRIEYLRIAGNYSKHNLSRLSALSRQIKQILLNSGYAVDEEMLPLALDDFREHLSENYFAYYATWLAELLNNLHWGVYDYLLPTYIKSYRSDPPAYSYDYPNHIQNEIPRRWFWRLMNNVRTPPYFSKFKGLSFLKGESSLEWD